MLETILKQREAKYGDFKSNIQSILAFKETFRSKEKKEIEDILAVLLSLKCARLLYIWNKEYATLPINELKSEDSYVDLLGYAELIRKNYIAFKMGFDPLLTDDEKTLAVKNLANYALGGVL